MITDPEPTLVMPTRRPPRAPTSRVGIGRMVGFSAPVGPPPRTRTRLTYSRRGVGQRREEEGEADAELQHVVELVGVGEPGDQVGPEQGHRHRTNDQPFRQRAGWGSPPRWWTIAPPVL